MCWQSYLFYHEFTDLFSHSAEKLIEEFGMWMVNCWEVYYGNVSFNRPSQKMNLQDHFNWVTSVYEVGPCWVSPLTMLMTNCSQLIGIQDQRMPRITIGTNVNGQPHDKLHQARPGAVSQMHLILDYCLLKRAEQYSI